MITMEGAAPIIIDISVEKNIGHDSSIPVKEPSYWSRRHIGQLLYGDDDESHHTEDDHIYKQLRADWLGQSVS